MMWKPIRVIPAALIFTVGIWSMNLYGEATAATGNRLFHSEKMPSGETMIVRSVFDPPFEIAGFPWRRPAARTLYRFSPELAKELSPTLRHIAHCTSGGTVRFATDSRRIMVRITLKHALPGGNMPYSGTGGAELAVNCGTPDESFYPVMIPTAEELAGKKPIQRTFTVAPEKQLREYTLFLPLYSGVMSLEIGVHPGSRLIAPRPMKTKDPICFYGSSITQGGCASRPSNSYSAMLCRELDAPQMNLGFTGNCRGEEAIARAIAGLNLSALVMDYDYNAPNVEHLRNTHEKFFRIVREAQPNLPIILISGPRDPQWPDSAARRDIVKATYDKAVAAGDKNVYFIDGLSFFDKVPRKYATVDQIHPNDLGMYIMFQRILPVLQQALAK